MPSPTDDRPRTSVAPSEGRRGAWGHVRTALDVRTLLLFVLVVILPGGLLLLPFALASARKGSRGTPAAAEETHREAKGREAYA